MSGAEDEPRKKRPKLVPDKKEDDKSNQVSNEIYFVPMSTRSKDV